ncbi:MAG: hypothetical protein ACLQU1_08605 [Bryobacteraceae bacterium]
MSDSPRSDTEHRAWRLSNDGVEWTDKRGAQGDVDINLTMQKLNAGRQRVAEEKAKRDAPIVQ